MIDEGSSPFCPPAALHAPSASLSLCLDPYPPNLPSFFFFLKTFPPSSSLRLRRRLSLHNEENHFCRPVCAKPLLQLASVRLMRKGGVCCGSMCCILIAVLHRRVTQQQQQRQCGLFPHALDPGTKPAVQTRDLHQAGRGWGSVWLFAGRHSRSTKCFTLLSLMFLCLFVVTLSMMLFTSLYFSVVDLQHAIFFSVILINSYIYSGYIGSLVFKQHC